MMRGGDTDETKKDLVCHGVPGQADLYACWANTIEGLSTRTLQAIKGVCGGKHEFAKCLYELPGQDLNDIARLVMKNEDEARKVTDRILKARSWSPEEELDSLRRAGVSTVCLDDAWYPERLRQIYNPPYILYYYGELPQDTRKSLAIIGSRMATPYGREQARAIATTMAANGVQIISGMARGIDGIAGRAALDAGGVSVAVLGGGPDICYPRENEALYEELRINGCLISEYHPGMQPQGKFFAARNRLISAFSDAVLVVEAKEKSGTMITVDFALEQGKDIFAVPGRVSDANSAGCNRLIQHGAGVVMEAKDLLEYFFGIQEDECRAKVSELRAQRAAIMTGGQRASFLERDGRGAGYLHQMTLEEQEHGQQQTKPCKDALPSGESNPQEQNTGNIKQSGNGYVREETARAKKAAELSALERNVLSCLDRSTPVGLEDILSQLQGKTKRRVAYSELVGCMTKLVVQKLVTEIRVGYYLEA